MTAAVETRSYPIPASADDPDPRFTLGLTFDVAKVLAEHGYPPITAGGDLVALQTVLFDFLYLGERRDFFPYRSVGQGANR